MQHLVEYEDGTLGNTSNLDSSKQVACVYVDSMKPRYVADAIGKGGVVRSRYEQTGEYVVVDNVPKLVWTDRVLGGKYYQGVSDMMVVYNATLDNTVLDREQMKEMYPEYII